MTHKSLSTSLVAIALCALLTISTSSAWAQTGLVAAYALNEGAGTSVTDISGNNNTGTISGATWTTSGKFGSALVFNGTSAKVTIPNSASLQLTSGMTLEAWVYPTKAPTGWRSIIDKNVDGYYLMASSSQGNLPVAGGTWAAGNQNTVGTAVLAVNSWTHMAATFDGAMVRLYVNGVLVSSQAQTTPLVATTGTLQIGADSYPTEYFTGRIDEVRIYNRALSATEIQTDMSTAVGTTPPPDTTAPSAPTGVTAAAISVSQINLSWTASTDNVGVTGYRLERCLGAGCTNFAQIATPIGTSYSDAGLTSNTVYLYRVRAIDAAGNLSPYSTTFGTTTPAPDTTPPTAPSSLTATAAGSIQINLSWTAATDNVSVTSYMVERCQGAGCTTYAQVATSTSTTYSDTGLALSTSYSYRVRAADAANNFGPYSNSASATTLATPAGLVAAYSFSEGSGTTVADTSGNANNGTISGATWTTAGKNGSALEFNGSSAKVTVANSTSLKLTTAMTMEAWVYPTSTPTGWRAVVDKTIDGYYLMASTDQGNRPAAGGTWTSGNQNTIGPSVLAVNTWTHLAATYDGATMRFFVNGVQVATQAQTAALAATTGALIIGGDSYPTEYFAGRIDDVRIYNRALSATEIQADMNTGVGSTPPPPDTTAPSVPTGLTATPVSSSQVNLAWNASTDNVGVTGYKVEHCIGAGCNSWIALGTVTGTTFVDSGLTASTTYRYWVRAVDAAGNLSGWSTIISATTPAPSAPDTTPPTVSMTAPSAGSSVSGTATISANAADNIGVVGVQFLLDGALLGAEQTGVYSLAWNTTTTTNGTHALSARARDAAGNTATSTSVSITVANSQATSLVAAYSFNEGAGTTLTDVSGNNNNGTISGATWTTSGKFGSALVFNGTSSKVTIPNAASLQLTAAMTMEAWVYPTSTPTGWRAVLDKNVDGYYLMASTSQGNQPGAGGTWTTGNQNTIGPAKLAINTWTHLAATSDGAMVRFYVNGVQVASQAQTAPLAPTTGTLQIGADSYPTEYFSGRIDEVRIYNRALSAAEIVADMNAGVTNTPPPADTTPPTVALTAPAANASVFGQVRLAANASDNVGVAGVQFLVDGQAVGSEVTLAPYSYNWDSTTATPGSHSITARARDVNNNTAISSAVSVSVSAVTPALAGQWAAPVTWPIVAVHANLMPTGEVLAWDGQTFGNDARIWNPLTGVFTAVPNNLTNIFCAGHCQLADGRLFVTGGHVTAHVGLPDANIFNATTRTWTKVASMAVGRWYPTNTTLPDGRILVTSGEINCGGCYAPIPEIYNPQNNTWTQLSNAPLSLPYYPHMFVLADGRVLAAATTEDMIVTQVLNVATQTWSVVDPTPVDGGSTVMYSSGKFMKSGLSVDPDQPVIPAIATTYVLDMNQATPRWRQTAPMMYSRTFHTLTLLPDGNVLATGGGPTTEALGITAAVLPAEIWSPTTETWTTVASMQKPRLYHSTALLMPDARVLVMGGGRFHDGTDPADQLNSEFYSPPYLFKGTRPTIASAPATSTYGASIAVQSPDAASISSVVLIKIGSTTHSINQDQRYVPLSFTASGSTLNVQTPANANLAPPGYYMLFILNTSGVPSVAAMLQLQ